MAEESSLTLKGKYCRDFIEAMKDIASEHSVPTLPIPPGKYTLINKWEETTNKNLSRSTAAQAFVQEFSQKDTLQRDDVAGKYPDMFEMLFDIACARQNEDKEHYNQLISTFRTQKTREVKERISEMEHIDIPNPILNKSLSVNLAYGYLEMKHRLAHSSLTARNCIYPLLKTIADIEKEGFEQAVALEFGKEFSGAPGSRAYQQELNKKQQEILKKTAWQNSFDSTLVHSMGLTSTG